MKRHELLDQLLTEIYGNQRPRQEFAKEYGLAVRHVKRMTNGYIGVPDRMFTWLVMRRDLGADPRTLDGYKAAVGQLDDPDGLPA